jgi:SNF family Na+-dependent transporter
MKFDRRIGFMLGAVIFMALAVYKATGDQGGSAVWVALGAVFIALGGAQAKKDKAKDSENEPR